MFCYNCGCQLSEYDYCPSCGTEVRTYKKIMYVSNRLYNEGLEKAGVRDLSGAIDSLRQSLKFNKHNIDARNLLGLVYYEMGEVVAALSEWIISQNFRKEKNIATEYIATIQSNTAKLEATRTAIHKYNQAYQYCLRSDGKDLAIIQLRQILGQNPHFIRAHQLLALLYLDAGEWEKAEREARKCLNIDHNNTMSLRYLQEAEQGMDPDDLSRSRDRHKKRDVVRYQSDNELIIQPGNVEEPRSGGLATLLNIIIGLIIGMAAIYFLVVPAKVADVTSSSQNQIRELGEQLDTKSATVQELESKIRSLETDNVNLQDQIAEFTGEGGALTEADRLIDVANTYITTGDKNAAAESLEVISNSIVLEDMSESYQALYQTMVGVIGSQMAASFYEDGYEAYRNGEYEKAAELLEKAVYYNPSNADALFNLANAYRLMGDDVSAINAYNLVIERFPDTERAIKSQQYIDEMPQG